VKPIALSKAPLTDEHRLAAMRALESGRFILGEECRQFELELARYFGVEHAVLCTSATAAITLTLLAWEIGEGDEVIVPSLTAFPTAEAVYNAGATPVYADVDESLGIDPAHVEQLVGPRTRGIIPVHLYGQPVDLEPLLAIARRRGLWVLEDCAQAHGARYRGQRVGSFGRAAVLSFYPSKNLTVFGDGGCVLVRDAPTAERVRMLRDHGRSDKYRHERVGFNLRFNEIQAALGRVSLARLDAGNEARRLSADRYAAELASLPGLALLPTRSGVEHVHHIFAVRILSGHRDEVARKLGALEIQTGVHYPIPCHRQPAVLARGPQPPLPRTDLYCDQFLSLPMHPELAPEEVRRVVSALTEALR
jgi:dTDP-4-amino-4,6-dideoxygalactose transaminase